jgi:hypothetical protein
MSKQAPLSEVPTVPQKPCETNSRSGLPPDLLFIRYLPTKRKEVKKIIINMRHPNV